MTQLHRSFAEMPSIVDGSLLDFTSDPLDYMTRLRERHGNLVVLQDGDRRFLFAFGAENNRIVLSDEELFESHFFVLRGAKTSSQRRLTCGLLNMNGPLHREQRRKMQRSFDLKHVNGYQAVVQTLTRQMLAGWKPGRTVDVAKEMRDLLQGVVCRILFGVDDDGYAHRVGHLLSEWMELNQKLSTAAFVPAPTFAAGYEEMLQKAVMIEQELATLIASQSDRSGQAENTLISRLLRNNPSMGRDDSAIPIGQLALLFAAGHLTTAYTLAWTLFLLTQHGEIEERFRADLGSPDSCSGMKANESFAYQVIRESMRLLPVSAYLQRVLSRPLAMGNIELSRTTPVIFSQFVTHRTETVFERSNEFDPDRWKTITPTPYQYLPFGAGRRMCIGAPLAIMIISTVLEQILAHCRLQLLPGSSVDARVISTMLSPRTPIMVRLFNVAERPNPVPATGSICQLVKLPELQPTVDRNAA